MCTGTETRPKDIVAVPVDLTGIGGGRMGTGDYRLLSLTRRRWGTQGGAGDTVEPIHPAIQGRCVESGGDTTTLIARRVPVRLRPCSS